MTSGEDKVGGGGMVVVDWRGRVVFLRLEGDTRGLSGCLEGLDWCEGLPGGDPGPMELLFSPGTLSTSCTWRERLTSLRVDMRTRTMVLATCSFRSGRSLLRLLAHLLELILFPSLSHFRSPLAITRCCLRCGSSLFPLAQSPSRPISRAQHDASLGRTVLGLFSFPFRRSSRRRRGRLGGSRPVSPERVYRPRASLRCRCCRFRGHGLCTFFLGRR